MRLQVRLSGTPQVREKYAAIGARLKDLNPAFLRGALVILSDAQGHIQSQGPGWAPQSAGPNGETNETGQLLYRTGALFRSLTVGGAGNIDQFISGGIRVGTGLTTPGGGYNIGRLMQYGVGAITPKAAKFLAFSVGGRMVFAKSTKGIPARPFLFVTSQLAQRVLAVFLKYLKGGNAE